MTRFGALLSLLGLSKRRAAVYLGMSEKSVEHFSAGHRRRKGETVGAAASPDVVADLVRAWVAIEAQAQAIVAGWRANRCPPVVHVGAVAVEAAEAERWSAIDTRGIVAGLVIAHLPPGIDVRIADADALHAPIASRDHPHRPIGDPPC